MKYTFVCSYCIHRDKCEFGKVVGDFRKIKFSGFIYESNYTTFIYFRLLNMTFEFLGK